MSQEYDNNMRGVLFKNTRMRDGKKDPEYEGQAEIAGIQYWVKSWINVSKKDGSKFMSLKFEPKNNSAKADTKAAVGADFDDDIPF